MIQYFEKIQLSKILIGKLSSLIFWRYLLFILVLFHFFTWSFPFPSDVEVEKYTQGLRGTSPEIGWSILIRLIDLVFGFGYAKFAFVLIGLACLFLLYQILARLANQYLAIIGALIFGANSFVFTVWHRTQSEIVIALFFLACIYIFVRFTTFWHLDIHKSANSSIFGIFIFAFVMLNTDLNSVFLMPSLGLMVFFISLRLYSLFRALGATFFIISAWGMLQWLIAPNTFGLMGDYIVLGTDLDDGVSIMNNLRAIYADGYPSDIWSRIYKDLDFLDLNAASHREREMFLYMFVGVLLSITFFIKLGRMLLNKRTKIGFISLVYNPHLSLILIISVAFIFSGMLQIQSAGLSSEYLFFQALILILLNTLIYSFFLKSVRERDQVATAPSWSELLYRPITITGCFAVAFFSSVNAYYYVAPYRGSNYPTLHDTLQRVWEGTGCKTVAYSPSLYAVSLAGKQSPPPKNLKDLFSDLKDERSLEEGCIILPLIAKDGVYNYESVTGKISGPIVDILEKKNFVSVANVTLPFYQKDPAYPVTTLHAVNPYLHAHGTPVFRFGGMEVINIYRIIK